MDYLLPQEIQVRYVIPAIRGELVKALIEEGMKQNEAAKVMGMTESAISQYLTGKRGKTAKIDKELSTLIKQSAEIIKSKQSTPMQELIKLTSSKKALEMMCSIHKESSPIKMNKCNMCFD